MTLSSEIGKIIIRARDAFNRNVTKPIDFRIAQLKQLLACIDENTEALVAALNADLRKHKFEALLLEIEFLRNDIQYQLNHIDEHVRPKRVRKPLALMSEDAFIKYDPYGVVLVFAAWNYPVNLLLSPVAGAIAAGNCVVLKPSEVCSNTEQLIASLLPKYLDKDCFPVITGGPDVAAQILQERFDLIFFTGSSPVGKIVYQAASQHMTPVVLELGGKSPLYIDDSITQMETAVRRILWGKFTNAGQTCIAPDYVMCTAEVQDKFVAAVAKVLKDFYQDDPKNSECLSRIVNHRNFDRLTDYLSSTKGQVTLGGETDREQLYIAPTIVRDVSPTDALMHGELFGPILPIMTVKSEDEAIEYINQGEKPLTMYLFTENKAVMDKFLDQTSSGSVCVNDTMLHLAVHTLPFGGVGNSGMGKYHGTYSFEAFSHSKAVLARNYNRVTEYLASCRYPPYTETNIKIGKVVGKPLPVDYLDFGKIFTVLVSVAVGMGIMFACLMWL